jgi:uncharacterized protein (TIGR02270 family)
MAAASLLKQVVEKHLQELGFLWRLREGALRSPDFMARDVKRLDSRLEAHLDGLRIAAATDLAAVAAHLTGDDPWAVLAAAVTLLQLETPDAANEVVQALRKAEPEQIDSWRRALLCGPIEFIEEQLREAAASAPPHIAAAALEALLYHGCQNVKTDRLPEFVRHENPAIRCAAWRIAALTSYSSRSA